MSEHPDPARLRSPGSVRERKEILLHVRRCPTCTRRLAEEDPVGLFSLLALREFDGASLETVSRKVGSSIRQARPSLLEAWRERGLPRFLPLAAAAAAAFAFLLLGNLGSPVQRQESDVALHTSGERADVHVTETPGPAQVVDLTVGQTQVVMIFAAEIEL